MMDWPELCDVAGAGHEIGAHSLTHPELDVLARGVVGNEIRGSRAALAEGLGRPIRSFAYPHGYHSASVLTARTRKLRTGWQSSPKVKPGMPGTSSPIIPSP